MNHQLNQIEHMVETTGTERTIVVIFLAIVVFMFGVFLKRYIEGQDEQKKINRENNKNYIDMIKAMTSAITKNTDDIGDFKEGLSHHTESADRNFKDITKGLDEIKGIVSDITRRSDDFATKNDLSKVESKIDEVKNNLKKD